MNYPSESHVIYQGIAADKWWNEFDRKQRKATRRRIVRHLFAVLAIILALFCVAMAVFWYTL